jgi:hypothetical protein
VTDRRATLDVVNLEGDGLTVEQALRVLTSFAANLGDVRARVSVSIRLDVGHGGRVKPLTPDPGGEGYPGSGGGVVQRDEG